ncbi:hypothetical protein ACJJTC_015594 [Scirpophaga incertulas]
MDTTCKYCNIPECKQDNPGLVCESCARFIHLTCLAGTPGNFAGDVFFDFTCAECSENEKESFSRNRLTWVNAILLTLHHMTIHHNGISNNGFFHYKTHICCFINKHWSQLFGPQIKQKKNWVGTLVGVLSVYSNTLFRSGSIILGETGWWKLMHQFSPALASHILLELSRDKVKGRTKIQHNDTFHRKVVELGYDHLLNADDADKLPSSYVPVVTPAKRKLYLEESANNMSLTFDHYDPSSRMDLCEYFDVMEATPDTGKGFDGASSLLEQPYQSDSSSTHSQQQTVMYDSDNQSAASIFPLEHTTEKPEATKKSVTYDVPFVKRESFFSTQPNSFDSMPWRETLPKRDKELVAMTQYEEIQLLKKVEGMIPKVMDPNKRAQLYRLRAKLSLRRLKRHKHLPIFDLDKAVRLLAGFVADGPKTIASADRVLDRFQRSYLMDNLCGTIASTNYGTILLPSVDAEPFRSAYSGAWLKPFIRRDAESIPLKLKLHEELYRKTSRIRGCPPPPRMTIDYAYVRPHHIAAVNALCAQYFWPGIDLSEALQYPEFSCVVSYGRVVVGCAFLVPGRVAYVSFVVTRPGWQRAGIASFMLYHLLQTCSGQDVTLHVSPTNPAIFLYQKFGFKVEEFIQDFYEKYYDMDYKGCRHALLLRLIR